jgi:hypothetical protein
MFAVLILWRKPDKVTYITKDNLDLLRKSDSLRDLAGHRWAVISAITVEKLEAQARADSMAKLLRIKPKYIKGQDIYISKTDTIWTKLPSTIMYSTEYKDTVYKVEKNDPYISVVAIAGKLGGTISVKSTDTLTRVEVIRNPLIGRTTRKVYLRNSSPYNKITEGMSYTVKEKTAFLTIGPAIGYDFIGKRPSVGVSIQYPLIKFKR